MKVSGFRRFAVVWVFVWQAAISVSAAQPEPAAEEGQQVPPVPAAATPQPETASTPAKAGASGAGQERRLKFNFRFQRWIDVLEWFAEKADLSLVVDSPPPGTFNYSDSREYTPSEAIDLLNGVLTTKGYTLVRRDRMLTVVNLAGGIPENLIERVSLEELDQRGKYEYVQVQFPLGERPAADVAAEIRPLLSKLGKSVPLPQTKQLLVTDTAGVMRAVGAVIQSIPEPTREPPPRRPTTPENPELVVYPLKTADPVTALEVLKAMLPGATLALDSRAEQINAYATPSQQAVAQAVLEQMQANVPPDKRPRLEVYRVREAEAAEFMKALAPVTPNAKLSVNATGEQLIAFGTPQEQEAIKNAIERLGGQSASAAARQIEVYRLTRTDATTTLTLLQSLFPRARLVFDKPTRSLIAVAMPEEHQSISAVLKQFEAEAADTDQQRQLVVYPINESRRKRLEAVLESAAAELPDVKVVKDGEPGQLAIWARPAEHRTLAELLEQLQRETPNENKHQVAVYALKTADPVSVLGVMQMLYPNTRFVLDSKARRLLAWGSKDDQQAVRATLEQMDSGTADDGQNKLMVYPLGGADSTAALAVLKGLAPDAILTADAKAGTIMAWARKADQTAIAEAVERMSSSALALTPQVYRFQRGDPEAAAKILATLVPAARLAVDAGNRSLVANATAADQAQIKATVELIDQANAVGGKLQPRTYQLSGVDGAPLLSTLTALFASRPEVRFSLDATNRKLLALASAEQHEAIRKIVDEAQLDAGIPPTARLEVYPLANADAATVRQVLGKLLGKQSPAADVSVDAASKQVIVVAEPQQHEQIRATLQRLQGVETDVAVLQLELLDTATAKTAIGNLFGETEAGAPKIGYDAGTAQIFVRGSVEQIGRIRELLVKMGETSLANSGATGAGRKLRIVPLLGDAQATLREIQRVWPQLRGNAIEVVAPSAIAPKLRQQSTQPPAAEKPTAPGPSGPPKDAPPPEPREPQSAIEPVREAPLVAAARFDERPSCAAKADDPPDSAPAPDSPPRADRPPILVAPSGDGLLIASDDTEALDQLEALIRALSRRGSGSGRDFAVIPLRIASAASVAESLERLFQGLAGRAGGSAVVVVADPRLNAVIVHASRSDRAAIERLIEVIDSPNAPESLVANKPTILSVKNTKAATIERILRNVYQVQLVSGGGRAPVPVPSGISAEMANVIRQVNAAVSGPQMTMSVDDVTNSLVIMAALPLVTEVTRLVESLDAAAADDPSRTVEIVPLRKTNVKRIEAALDTLLKEPVKRRGRDTRAP